MPLPPALLARLAKRGIVNSGKGKNKSNSIQNLIQFYCNLASLEPEETFAEDYSERDDNINPENYEYQSRKREDNVWTEKLKRRFKETTLGVKGCPNKWNIFHICTVFCLERWGEGPNRPTKSYRERFQRLLERYPLSKHWVQVWDSGCESYYFWNKNDDQVSWLPPKHPKALLGKSAATLRSEKDRPDMDSMDNEPPMMPQTAQRSPPPEERYRPAPTQKKTKSRDLEKILRTKKGRKQFHENSGAVDPMDPAAYSECGRGKWSAGLNTDEGKTGVDTTASGQLFQQRPYPSPGDILRANQAAKRGGGSDDGGSDDDKGKRGRYTRED